MHAGGQEWCDDDVKNDVTLLEKNQNWLNTADDGFILLLLSINSSNNVQSRSCPRLCQIDFINPNKIGDHHQSLAIKNPYLYEHVLYC